MKCYLVAIFLLGLFCMTLANSLQIRKQRAELVKQIILLDQHTRFLNGLLKHHE